MDKRRWAFLVISCFIGIIQADLVLYGVSHGDQQMNYEASSIQTEELELLVPMRFMGEGIVSKLFVSSVGTISYTKLQTTQLDHLSSNVILTPFMSNVGNGGSIFYRQTDSDIKLMSEISKIFKKQGKEFHPIFIVVVTWENMPSPDDPTQMNTYQIVIASNAESTYVIFNYKDSLKWSSSSSSKSYAGVFAAGSSLEKCEQPLEHSGTDEIWILAETSTNAFTMGQHILDISKPLKCYNFESPCGEPPKFHRAIPVAYFKNTDDNFLGWDFYLSLNCKEGLQIAPGVTSQPIMCQYEPDYYEYAWEFDVRECLDLSATRKFDISIGDIQLGVLTSQNVEEVKGKLIPEVNKLLKDVEITDVVVELSDVTKKDKINEEPNFEENIEWNLKLRIMTPTYVNREVTGKSLKTKLENLLSNDRSTETFKSNNVTVSETTNKCLQECICFLRESSGRNCIRGNRQTELRPDACCGGCNGKPYASSKKVCCGGRTLYNPRNAVCCNGRVFQGLTCPFS